MNYDKYKQNEKFDDFDVVSYLGDKFHHQGGFDGEEKDYFVLDRDSAHMLLKACTFNLSDGRKKSINYLCNVIRKSEDGKFPNAPKKPIRIKIEDNHIVDGVTRLFVLLYQRTPRCVWVELDV